MRENGGDGEAAGALDVHEEGSGLGNKGLERRINVRYRWSFRGDDDFVFDSYLELVLLGLSGR